MTITLKLRSDAEAEASRLRAARSGSAAATSRDDGGDISVTELAPSRNGALREGGAIFFVRARSVAATGRLLETVLVPVQVSSDFLNRRSRRSVVRSRAQRLIERCEAAVIAAAREHMAARMAETSRQYGRGLERAATRERRIGEILARGEHQFVQAGLFDRRSLKDRDAALTRESAATGDSDTRRRSLESEVSGIASQDLRLVLLLLGRTRA